MSQILADICYIRSGDKGDICTAGLIARDTNQWERLKRSVSPEKVMALYGDWVGGPVHGYPMENIQAVVVVMEHALGGGATRTLRLDQTGKSFGHALLRLPVID